MGKPYKTIVLEDNFEAARDALKGELLMEAAKAGGFVIEGHAKVNAGSGRPGLQIQSGALVNSIHVEERKKTEKKAEVGVGTNIVYARIHELGGLIIPLNFSKLSWVNDQGQRIFAGAVHIPARPYLRPAMDENEDKIVTAVKTEIQRNLDRATK